MYGCTVAEAARLGRFLSCMFQLIKKWKENKSIFEKEIEHVYHITYPQFSKLTVVWEYSMRDVCVPLYNST